MGLEFDYDNQASLKRGKSISVSRDEVQTGEVLSIPGAGRAPVVNEQRKQTHTLHLGNASVSTSRIKSVAVDADTGEPLPEQKSKLRAAIEGAALGLFAADEHNIETGH